MRKKILLLLPVLGMIAGAAIFTSCGGDEDPAPPTASFTYEADGRDVTFTNTSTNATTFAWDFGDGSTSTEKNPTHTYAVFGKYSVKLSATGEGGTANSPVDELTLAKTSVVSIDGNVSEWSDIPVSIASTDAASGTVTKIKVDYDAQNIYFYVEGTANLRGFFDVYIDTDNDSLTGYYSNWYPKGFGADYFAESNFGADKTAPVWSWKQDGGFDRGDWAGWGGAEHPVWTAEDKVITSSALVTVGSGKGIEFLIKRSSFTNLSDDGFAYAVADIDEGWSPQGVLPISHIAGVSKLQFFDLTK